MSVLTHSQWHRVVGWATMTGLELIDHFAFLFAPVLAINQLWNGSPRSTTTQDFKRNVEARRGSLDREIFSESAMSVVPLPTQKRNQGTGVG